MQRCACIMFALLGPTPAVAAELPIELFTNPAQVRQVVLAPDSTHIAIATKKYIQIVNLETQQPKPRFNITGKNVELGTFWWVSSERLLLTTTFRYPGYDLPFLTGNYYSLDIDGKGRNSPYRRSRDAPYTGVRFVDVLKNDPKRVAIQLKSIRPSVSTRNSKPKVRFLDVYGKGKARFQGSQSAPLPNGNLYVGNEGTVRIAIGFEPGNDHPTILYRDNRNADWQSLTEKFEIRKDADINFVGFAGDNKDFYVLSDHASDTQALYVYRTSTNKLELLYENANFDVAGIEWNRAHTEVVGIRIDGNYPELVAVKPDDPEIVVMRQLEKLFPGQSATLSSPQDSTRAVLRVRSDRNPGDFYLYDFATRKLSKIISARPELDRERMAPMQPFTITSRDGLQLQGYLTVPNTVEERAPLIVMPHGGPIGVRDRWRFDPIVQLFANRGFAVLQVNFRGSGGFGTKFENAGYLAWSTGMIDDLLDATAWVADQPTVDRNRMCIFGASYGAFAALSAVAEAPDLFRCAAGHVGVYDLELMWGEGDIPKSPSGVEYLERAIGKSSSALKIQSPVNKANKIKVPVFLSAGGKDERAPVEHTRRMKKALEAHDVPVVSYVESGESHGFYDTENRSRLYGEILDFIRSNTNAK